MSYFRPRFKVRGREKCVEVHLAYWISETDFLLHADVLYFLSVQARAKSQGDFAFGKLITDGFLYHILLISEKNACAQKMVLGLSVYLLNATNY